ncbi:hypothetical protein OUY22_03755 [Nonomuraea sp. MCN248]|uniref:Uncharacterized protein n=1 Tax=Nonomuraea corallina TaxID=2989783 RepID=A0ABT4S5P4_9ACTN|nr:hypothetical protein [Nonomuraea corallina]MDA0632519.1 hypothetical protein [Nonomuraea corallina]
MAADELADFHGPHVGPPWPGRTKLTWHEPFSRASRIRVISHTCECGKTMYELCAAAGLGFVRRTDRAKRTVHETAWMLTATAADAFGQILDGKAG